VLSSVSAVTRLYARALNHVGLTCERGPKSAVHQRFGERGLTLKFGFRTQKSHIHARSGVFRSFDVFLSKSVQASDCGRSAEAKKDKIAEYTDRCAMRAVAYAWKRNPLSDLEIVIINYYYDQWLKYKFVGPGTLKKFGALL